MIGDQGTDKSVRMFALPGDPASFEWGWFFLRLTRERYRHLAEDQRREIYCGECGFRKATGHAPDCHVEFNPASITFEFEEAGIFRKSPL